MPINKSSHLHIISDNQSILTRLDKGQSKASFNISDIMAGILRQKMFFTCNQSDLHMLPCNFKPLNLNKTFYNKQRNLIL